MGYFSDLLDGRQSEARLLAHGQKCEESEKRPLPLRRVNSLLSLISQPAERPAAGPACTDTPEPTPEENVDTVTSWKRGLAKLRADRPPPGMPMLTWCQFLDDARMFMERWAEQAAELGWTAEDLFGVHPIASDARHDAKGLVPLIGGEEVVEVAPDRAVILHRATGSKVVYVKRRRPEAVAVWEIVQQR